MQVSIYLILFLILFIILIVRLELYFKSEL